MRYISPEECELVGALIGDGNIYIKGRKRIIGFTGNQINDKEYFYKLKTLIKTAWGRDVVIKFRENAVRIQFHSVEIVNRLVNFFGLPANRGKHLKVFIPSKIAENWKLARHTIRGIVDTDGSIFVADKLGSPNYPSIEITTTSKRLALQLKKILSEKKFRVAKVWQYKSKNSVHNAFKVPLNGWNNLALWLSEIGFSNPHKFNKAISVLQQH